ncbi:MAG: DUF2164 domain-containing protein [Fusobacteriaceae bacterium]
MYEFNKHEKDEMIREIQFFFKTERDEEIGNLAAEIVLDFVSNKLGKNFFNKGVRDARKFMLEKLDEIIDVEK